MSDKTVAQKARVKPGTTIAVINSVRGIVESLGLPEGVAFVQPANVRSAERERYLAGHGPQSQVP